ncbi:MAG: TRAP transporter large permease subunit [Rhodobacterales bacterium]|nr:TRAP transporter large permease subunit [Rhodobacterales bacterium]MDX5498526.1 TRAP transporter large permease subunit [Rhodobacterales bacterium]
MITFLAAHLDLLLFAALVLMLLCGFPVAFTLGGCALAFALMGSELGLMRWQTLNFLPQRVWVTLNNNVLVAAPLFIFMGLVLERCRLAEDMLTCLAELWGQRPGGLLMATTLVGALIAASTGIVGATVVTLGLLTLPVMVRNGYNVPLACGAICAAGTLGQIIPPSIVLVFLGDFISLANQQAALTNPALKGVTIGVSDLFAGAIVPGLLLVCIYIAYQTIMVRLNPSLAPPIAPADRRLMEDGTQVRPLRTRLLQSLVAPLALIVAVLGSILSGIATPTEAAAVGAVGAVLLSAWREAPRTVPVLRAGVLAAVAILVLLAFFDLRIGRAATPSADLWAIRLASVLAVVVGVAVLVAFGALWRAGLLLGIVFRTARITAMVFTVLLGATLFTLVFRELGGEATIHGLLANIPGGLFGAMVFTMLLMFVLGFFLDFLEIVFILVPILCPALILMGANPLWLGVIIALNLQTSFLTPPFGFALFYLRGVAPASVSTMQIWRGAVPYVMLQMLCLVIVAAFPALATWLPGLM